MTPNLLFVVLAISYLAILGTKAVLVSIYLVKNRSRGLVLQSQQAAQVAIAQPILSGDPALADTLLRAVESLPREVEFHWLVDRTDQVAIEIAKSIRTRFSNIHIQEFEESPPHVNPKVFKLQKALERVDRDYFVVMDDDTTVDTTSLAASLDSLAQGYNLYTGLPHYRKAASWGRLVSSFVNSSSALTYLPPLVFAPPISINGMFYVVKTNDLKVIGGFVPIQNELCDDYALKKHVANHQWKIQQGTTTQSVGTSVASASAYMRLLHRWNLFGMLLLREQSWHTRIWLALSLGLPPLLLGLTVLCGLIWPINLVGLVGLLVLRHVILVAVNWLVFRKSLSLGIAASVIAEVLQPVHVLHATVAPVIRWRSRLMRVRVGGQFESLGDAR